ncbi:MAG TPA: hypothetical protein VGI10_29585 [Polyangiaceae bacterium]
MSDQREARNPSPSSEWPGLVGRRVARLARPGLIVLFVVHFVSQAISAHNGHARSRFHETEPWVLLASIFWLIFLAFAAREMLRSKPVASDARTRALLFAEQGALWVLIAFSLGHGFGYAWQLLNGELLASDLRPSVVAALSSTTHGVPLVGAGYLCAVGAASFIATRFARHELGQRAPQSTSARRAPVALGLCLCALGVYSVLRFATGSILP